MILLNRRGGLERNSQPLLSDLHLKDLPALFYKFGGR